MPLTIVHINTCNTNESATEVKLGKLQFYY